MKKALSLALALLMLMTMCVVPVMAAEPDGSAENPYYVANPMAAPGFITIPANSTVYYQYKAAVFAGWEVGGYGLSAIIVDGVVYDTPDMWGEIYAPLNFTFMSPGVVGYVNDSAEDVEVMISHNEPLGTENNPDTLEDGENTFSIPANNPSYVADYMPTANGEYTFACEQTEDFIISVDVDGTTYTLDGSLTLTLESYIPVRFYISPVGVTPDVTINVTAPKAGTEGNPHWLETDVLYEINGTEPVYFQVDGSLSGNELLIESFNGVDLTVVLDGVEHTASCGSLYLPLETTGWAMELVISQAAESNNTVYFSVKYAEGKQENPIDLALGDNEVSVPAGSDGYYYNYTVESDGLLVVTPASVDGIGYLDMANADYSSYTYLQEGASSMMMPVTAGETILMNLIGAMDEETFENLPVDTVLNITVKDLVLFDNFEDSNVDGWSSDSPISIDDVDYASGWYSAKFEATKNWVSMYRYLNVEANTDYVISFKMKALLNNGLWVKFNNNWGPDLDSETITPTTEWADYEVTLNSGETTSLILMLQYTNMGEDGQVFWFDDIVVTKAEADPIVPDEPPVEVENLIVNGGFETGELAPWDNLYGWTSPSIVEDAHTGSYALQYSAAGAWQHVRQIVSVEANTDYVLTLWAKDANALTFLIKDGADTTNLKEGYSEAGSEWKQYTVEFNSGDNTSIIFTLMSNGANATGIIDDVVLAKVGGDTPVEPPVEPPVEGNLVVNGDFEAGNADGWTQWYPNGVEFSVVEGGHNSNYAVEINGLSAWHNMRQQIAVDPNGVYTVSAWVKKSANFDKCNFKLMTKNESDTADIDGVMVQLDNDEWQKVTFPFESGENRAVYLQMMAFEDGVGVIIDDITMVKVGGEDPIEPSFDGYLTNGDFECGTLDGWDKWHYDWYTTTSKITNEVVFEGEYALALEGMDSHIGLYQTIAVEADSDYTLKFWFKSTDAAGSTYWIRFRDAFTDEELAVETLSSSTSEWTEVVIDLYTWDSTSVRVEFVGYYGQSTQGVFNMYVDSMVMEKVAVEPDITYGDSNDDGKVNNKDLALLQQYLADWDVEIPEAACDVNCDGKVNNKDLALLQQYLADWDVELGQ